MKVLIVKDYEQMSRIAADIIADLATLVRGQMVDAIDKFSREAVEV